MSGKNSKSPSRSTPTASKCYCGSQSSIRSPILQRHYAACLTTPRPKATGTLSSGRFGADAAYDQAFLDRGGPLAPARLVSEFSSVQHLFLLQREDRCIAP